MRVLSWCIKIFLVILLVLLVVNLYSMLPSLLLQLNPSNLTQNYYSPNNYPNSIWATENGEITFRVDEESQVRYNGTVFVGESVIDVQPFETNMFGKINKNGTEYNVFIRFWDVTQPSYMTLLSEEMPYVGEPGEYDEDLEKYKLASFEIKYENTEHFTATVDGGTLYEKGTVFDFYRQE